MIRFIHAFVIVVVSLTTCESNTVEMKIVDEVSNYGWNAQSSPDSSRNLVPSEKPSAFSGPEYFRSLHNKCFILNEQDYKYELCLFNNVTQHERTLRWNPYSGILGIWNEWEILNNTFVSMIMKNGDECGQEKRQAKVKFICGTSNNFTSVSEPARCNYNLVFSTPIACHEDVMLVYPVLNVTLRHEWTLLEQELYDGIITTKGYEMKLAWLFFKAGLRTTPIDDDIKKFNGFDSLSTCNSKYIELLEENKKLKAQLLSMKGT